MRVKTASARNAFACLAAALAGAGCESSAPATAVAAPEPGRSTSGLVCDEPVWEIGSADSRGFVSHDFVLRNNGSTTVEVAGVDFDCGCMIAGRREGHIAPGQEFVLPVTLNLDAPSGRFQKRVFVQISAPRQEQLVLKVVGTVKPNGSLFALSKIINFGRVRRGERVTRTATLGRSDGTVVDVVSAESDSPALSLDTDGVRHDPASNLTQVPLTLNTESLPVGEFRAAVAIHTGHSRYRTLRLGILATIAPDAHALRQSVFVPAIRPGQRVQVSLRDPAVTSEEPLRVTACRFVGHEGVSVGLSGLEAIELRADEALRPPQLIEGVLKTSFDSGGISEQVEIATKILVVKPNEPGVSVP